MGTPDRVGQQVDARREDAALRLLDVGLEIIDDTQRAKQVFQRESAQDLDLSPRFVVGGKLLADPRAVPEDEVAQGLLYGSHPPVRHGNARP